MLFHVEAMTCGGCARAVTAAIRGLDPTAEVRTDPPSHTVEVQTSRPEVEVRAALAAAGFPAR
jgi:copper chaperone CopZ